MNVMQTALSIGNGQIAAPYTKPMQLREEAPVRNLLALEGVLEVQVTMTNGAILRYWKDED